MGLPLTTVSRLANQRVKVSKELADAPRAMDDAFETVAPWPQGDKAGDLRLMRDVPNADVIVFFRELSSLTASATDVRIDCSAAEYLGGACWQLMLSLRNELKLRRGTLELTNAPASLCRASQFLGLKDALVIRPLKV
jgi:ABC-type transporter Mla MlaB component